MGQRDRLMAAAKRCLHELGYARTTSRELASAAEANIASICYHYGSKDELLTTALLEIADTWKERTVGVPADLDLPPRDRLERMWAQLVESFTAERAMLVGAMEVLAQAERLPRVREQVAEAYERARPRLAEDFHGLDPAADERTARAVGSVHMALIAGLSQQWLVDPERAPSGDEVVIGLRAILADLEKRD